MLIEALVNWQPYFHDMALVDNYNDTPLPPPYTHIQYDCPDGWFLTYINGSELKELKDDIQYLYVLCILLLFLTFL